jgi:membrane-associated phospholipid phosphatase
MDSRNDESSLTRRGVKRFNLNALLVAALFVFTLAGCGTLQNGRGWGQDAIYPVDSRRISSAAYHAFFDLQTLLPAAGALVFCFDNYDQRVSDWATTNHPIFGSQNNASQASDYLSYGLGAETLVTALATPSGKDPKDWVSNKAKGIAVELGAQLATAGVTGLLKSTTNRARPNGTSSNSFPSSHSSTAFSSATLSNRNLNSIKMPVGVRLPLQIGNVVIATGVAWARVEAGSHYPSDVLAGAAIGHFLSAFIYDAFMGLPEQKRWDLYASPTRGGAMFEVSFGF